MTIIEDIYLNLYVNNKKLWFTNHINQEMDEENKDRFFIAEILDKGEKRLVSKKQKKYETRLDIGRFEWIVSYVEGDNIITLIHLGKKAR